MACAEPLLRNEMGYTLFGREQLLDICVDWLPKIIWGVILSFGGHLKASLNTAHIVQPDSRPVNMAEAGRSHLKYSIGEF